MSLSAVVGILKTVAGYLHTTVQCAQPSSIALRRPAMLAADAGNHSTFDTRPPGYYAASISSSEAAKEAALGLLLCLDGRSPRRRRAVDRGAMILRWLPVHAEHQGAAPRGLSANAGQLVDQAQLVILGVALQYAVMLPALPTGRACVRRGTNTSTMPNAAVFLALDAHCQVYRVDQLKAAHEDEPRLAVP